MHGQPQPKVDVAATLEQVPTNCPQCGSTRIKPAVIKTAFWHKDRLVVVEDLPALVCGKCGERFYEDGTATILDLMRGRNFPLESARRILEVPVFSFSDHVVRQVPEVEDEG